MKTEILKNGYLRLTLDPFEKTYLQEQLEEKGDTFDCDDVMYDLFEPFIANSEFAWIRPEETGDLTDAPMLRIREPVFVSPVLQRWAWMDYAVQSLQRELLDHGTAVLQGGDL